VVHKGPVEHLKSFTRSEWRRRNSLESVSGGLFRGRCRSLCPTSLLCKGNSSGTIASDIMMRIINFNVHIYNAKQNYSDSCFRFFGTTAFASLANFCALRFAFVSSALFLNESCLALNTSHASFPSYWHSLFFRRSHLFRLYNRFKAFSSLSICISNFWIAFQSSSSSSSPSSSI
jgi:hypothetical protein